ncbi:MAG: HAD family phosphatase [Lentisphaeria bacterium]|nr:HAD family phosphatase [Lentisphaeria bacterium]
MKLKGAIFDLDGTLLDSMGIWSNLCGEFLHKYGIDEPVDLENKLQVLSIRNALDYILKLYPSIGVDLETAWRETMERVASFYRHEVQLRPGITGILDELTRLGIPAGIITATETELVHQALRRVGLHDYFTAGVMSCVELQTTKRKPEVFFSMAEKFAAAPGEVIVFEDTLYAAATAKNAGFVIAAVHDPSEKRPQELQSIADCYCRSWEEFPLELLGGTFQ